MVITSTNKMFLLTFVLFVLCVVLFFVLVSLRKSEKTSQWEAFINRGQARLTDSGDTNHWYFVIRDLDKIRHLSEVRNIERATWIEKTAAGFVLHGTDYEIAFDRVVPGSKHHHPMHPQPEEEDYTLALVKRKLYPWDVKSKRNDEKG